MTGTPLLRGVRGTYAPETKGRLMRNPFCRLFQNGCNCAKDRLQSKQLKQLLPEGKRFFLNNIAYHCVLSFNGGSFDDKLYRGNIGVFIGNKGHCFGAAARDRGCHGVDLLAHFCTEAMAGLLIDEFTDKEGHDPEKAVKYLSVILKSSLPEVLRHAAADGAIAPGI